MACHPGQDDQPDMDINNIQSDTSLDNIIPDDSTYDIRASVKNHLKFETLPREIRDEIYPYVVEEEQQDIRECATAWDSDSDQPLSSLLLAKTRPPALFLMGNNSIRAEHLPHFFHGSRFRVYIDIGKVDPAAPKDIPTAWQNDVVPSLQKCITIDGATRDWLDSLQISNRVVFRNVQFQLTHQGGLPISSSFNISYSANDQRYKGEFVLLGWTEGPEIEAIPNVGLQAALLPRQAWEVLRKAAEEAKEEVLDWSFLQRLMGILGSCDGFEGAVGELGHQSLMEVQNWNAEVSIRKDEVEEGNGEDVRGNGETEAEVEEGERMGKGVPYKLN